MRIRALSALVGVVLFLTLCFGGPLPFTVAVTALTALGVREWVAAYRAVPLPDSAPTALRRLSALAWLNPLLAWCGVALPVVAYGLCRFASPLLTVCALKQAALVALFAALVIHAARTGRTLGRLRALYGLVAFAYIGTLFSSFVLLRALPGRLIVAPFGEADRGAWLMLFVAVCVWATDTCAYLVGRSLGRHKLAPSLSPNKTREGALGGLLGAMAAGAAFGTWIHLPLGAGLAVGAVAGIVGQWGDLFESALKREAGLKDFGSVMPGHGGVLDRFDSLLFVTPLAYLVLRFVFGL